jgi:hypothetical protein
VLFALAWPGVGLVLACATAGCGGALASSPSSGDGGQDATSDAGDDGTSADGAGDDGPMLDGIVEIDGTPACDQGVCPSPASVAGFTPSWIPPTGAHQNLCTTAMLDAYYADCLDTDDTTMPGDCSAFGVDPAEQACEACLTSSFTDPTWGPLVAGVADVETNTSGCIALLDPGAIPCAQALQAADECEHAACDQVCAGGDPSGFDSWVTCSSASNSCGCAPYFAATDCVKALAGAQSPAAPCLVGQTFQDLYYSVAAVFCGP